MIKFSGLIICVTIFVVAFLMLRAVTFATPLGVDVSLANIKDTVLQLTAIVPPRNSSNHESLEKAAGYIESKLTAYGLKSIRQEFEVNGGKYFNIIAYVGPPDAQILVVGAHYDVCGDTPGADDNASGVAGLLEIARFAAESEDKLAYRCVFVAYALEEPPYFGTEAMGSYVHAASLKQSGAKLYGMICLEMLGYFTEEEKSQEYPLSLMKLFYPTTGNFIGVVSNFNSSSLTKEIAIRLGNSGVKVRTLKSPSSITGVDFSDHRNYWKFGYPAVMVTDTSFYRNPNYHRTSDTPATLSYDKIRDVTKGLCLFLLRET